MNRPTSPLIKVCGLTRPEDVACALDLGADFLGVIRYERSPRHVPRADLPQLRDAIPAGRRVAVDVAPSVPLLGTYLREGFDYFQIHFDPDFSWPTIADWSALVGPARLWLAPRLPPEIRIFPKPLLDLADTFVIDAYSKSHYGGSGRVADWERFADWQTLYQHKRWVLAGGLGPDNLAAALSATAAAVVDVNSGVETASGRKDPARLRRFFQIARPTQTGGATPERP